MRIGHNANDQTFWTVSAPPEFGSIEFTVIAKAEGLDIAGELLSWAEVKKAKERAEALRDADEGVFR